MDGPTTIIVVSEASRALLAARAPSGRLRTDGETACQQADGRWRLVVEVEVAEALALVDPDPDRAIEIMCTTGVGHA